jgi:hypothetical protein
MARITGGYFMKIAERGWAGHFIASRWCLFKRNTLIEHENIKIVVSTVGNYAPPHNGFNTIDIETIGYNRYFETMAFHADPHDEFMDANVTEQISFESDWAIGAPWKEKEANEMHDKVVQEIMNKLLNGEKYLVSSLPDEI